MAEGSVYFGAVAGSYASGLCFAKFGYQVAMMASHHTTGKNCPLLRPFSLRLVD